MSDWDIDGPRLTANLLQVQRQAVGHVLARRRIALADIKSWHRTTMRGLAITNTGQLHVNPQDLIGKFRGPPKLAQIEIRIGAYWGVRSADVPSACEEFIGTLQALLDALDATWPADQLDDLDQDGLRAVAEVAAWAHSEWVRIHPFANGNGRIARLLGNVILVRYGLPPVLRLRPRPDDSYASAAISSMRGDHRPMTDYVINLLLRHR